MPKNGPVRSGFSGQAVPIIRHRPRTRGSGCARGGTECLLRAPEPGFRLAAEQRSVADKAQQFGLALPDVIRQRPLAERVGEAQIVQKFPRGTGLHDNLRRHCPRKPVVIPVMPEPGRGPGIGGGHVPQTHPNPETSPDSGYRAAATAQALPRSGPADGYSPRRGPGRRAGRFVPA